MPKRIQRKRTKGWRMPPNTVSVTRPGKFGNPFRLKTYVRLGNGGDGFMYLVTNDEKYCTGGYRLLVEPGDAVDVFREFRTTYPLKADEIAELRGKDLACWCKLSEPCHADVLLELANSGAAGGNRQEPQK